MHHTNTARLAITGLFTLLMLTGCATTVITPEVEDQLGAQMDVQVQDQIGLYRQPALEQYVRDVGNRLALALGSTPYTFRFAIVDQGEPNAFATPGGFVYVSRGLLAQMNSEAELAGVLAHEISHITQRHHARQVGRSVGAGLFTLPGRAVGVISQDLGNMINAPVEAAGKVYLSSFSRGQETEADAYGMRLAAAAGYAPMALADALQGIERAVEYLTGEKHQASWFDSHPTTPTRVSDIHKQAATISVTSKPPLAGREQLFATLDGLWWGPQNPQTGVFHQQAFLSADMNFTLSFPQQWKTINTPRFVGAAEPEGGAFIALGSANPAATITEMTDTVEQKMAESAGIQPGERRAFRIGTWPAEMLRYDDTSGEETVSLWYLFVQGPTEKFKLMAMGLEHHREALRQTVASLRQLTAAERNSIGGQRLRLVTPQAGESLASAGQRSGNKWSPEFTAIVNGLDKDAAPAAGKKLKVLRNERYTP